MFSGEDNLWRSVFKDVRELLGLSSVNTTMNIYAHAKKETTGSSARFLDKVAGES